MLGDATPWPTTTMEGDIGLLLRRLELALSRREKEEP